MGEVKPMLLSETWDKSILNDDSKFFQVKENGVRALVHIKQGKVVGIRNRSNNSYSNYRSIVNLRYGDCFRSQHSSRCN